MQIIKKFEDCKVGARKIIRQYIKAKELNNEYINI